MPAHRAENCTDFKVELNFPPIRHLVSFMIGGLIVGLMCCLLTAKIFQNEQLHDAGVCKDGSLIPSISTVIGMVPQIYFWRIYMAFVVVPKVFLSQIYRAYFLCLADTLRSLDMKKLAHWLSGVCFWCNVADTIALSGLSCISSHENFSLHEKFFLFFLTTSFFCMVLLMANFILFWDHLPRTMLISLRTKVILFCLAVAFGMIMLYFYQLHVTWCVENAFSWFSLCEYGMIFSILSFHWTIVLDFPNKRTKLRVVDT